MSLLVHASGPRGDTIDLRCEDGRIVEVGSGLRRSAGETAIDARRGAVLPGLHDHHIHLMATLAARESVPVGPDVVHGRAGLERALRSAAAFLPRDGWIRATGYHSSVAGDLDRYRLDAIVPDRPVRVQDRSGALWTLNSAALTLVGAEEDWTNAVERGADGRPTGRLWRSDQWLAARLARRVDFGPRALEVLSSEALAVGVTGWTDATPELAQGQTSVLVEAKGSGFIRQRLHLMVPADPDAWHAMGSDRTFDGLSFGPVKVMLDDDSLPNFEDFVRLIAETHRLGRGVATHCVTHVQLALTMAALEAAGHRRGDRIEHGALVASEWLKPLAASEIVVVTQPNFVAERGDQYLADVALADQPDLWRGRSLVDAGVTVAAGSDGPFGSLDPWNAIRAAIRRRTPSGRLLGQEETVSPGVALSWWTGTADDPGAHRRLALGEPADLVVLGAPLLEALAGDGPVPVMATVVGGEIVFEA